MHATEYHTGGQQIGGCVNMLTSRVYLTDGVLSSWASPTR